ncbi:MAG: DUF429 domain-containing protein [Ignisphaera sp.]
MVVGGLDLAAYEYRCSGFAVIDEDSGSVEELACIYRDSEIIENTSRFSIDVLAIDAPIAKVPRFREVDREAIRRGFRVMPPTFRHMKILTVRAWRLYQFLSSIGVTVIETHPRSALKNSGLSTVDEVCRKLNVSMGRYIDRLKHKDLRDALISALVALCYRKKFCIEMIEAVDGVIYIISSLQTTL